MLTIFRSRLRPEHAAEYEEWAGRIESLARTQPGFVAIKEFAAEDGERVSLVEFADRESHVAWRAHPEHREAMQRGRERFYSEYRIQVGEEERERVFRKD